jgi:hypothetical protein
LDNEASIKKRRTLDENTNEKIKQALLYIYEAQVVIKDVMKQREEKSPILMRYLKINRKGKPNIQKKIPIITNDFTPRSYMLGFMKGYDKSLIRRAIDSITASHSIYQMQMIRSKYKLIPKCSTDITKIKVLALVKLKVRQKKKKLKRTGRAKYPIYTSIIVQDGKMKVNTPLTQNTERSPIQVWNYSKDTNIESGSVIEFEPAKQFDVQNSSGIMKKELDFGVACTRSLSSIPNKFQDHPQELQLPMNIPI